MIVDVPWTRLVLNWGNFDIFVHATGKVLSYQIILIAIPTILCQGFYLYRLWMFSKKNIILVGICGVASLAGFALDLFLAIQTTVRLAAFKEDTSEIVAMFGIGAITDLVIALSLVYYLRRGMGDIKSTNFVVTRVIRYTVATGLLSSIVAIFSLIMNVALPNTRLFQAGHLSLGRMYSNALLANLNSRATLRATFKNPLDVSVSVSQSAVGGTVSQAMFVKNGQSGQSETLNDYAMGELKRGELSQA
ncbi:ANK-REP-REGION domain-containing protein [Mycena kentingensis (nom. inval.)]|nr:ANK-REP-REGION domain-containing protein [Mycena kentingensis (nom. inval.)]